MRESESTPVNVPVVCGTGTGFHYDWEKCRGLAQFEQNLAVMETNDPHSEQNLPLPTFSAFFVGDASAACSTVLGSMKNP